MKILVVGGTGFIGSNLCKRLLKDGHTIFSLDNYFTGKKENHIQGIGYIKDSSKFIDMWFPEKPDIVYHLGEYSRVLPSFEDVDKVIEFNLIGTARVIEYCRKNNVRLIYAGSSTKFGDAESPYSFIKKHNTELIKKYGKWFGLDYAITYFYNVYGPGEIRKGKYATLIGIFSENVINGRSHQINAPGTQKRAFTHISDIIEGLVLVGNEGKGEYCLGNPKEYSILEVAKMFGGKIKMSKEKKGDRSFSKIDLTRIKKLGWKAKIDLKDYIKSKVWRKK
jgi:UDP-glucose 4-epimerase